MKKTFTGKTRLFLCISGAIIALALVLQIAGVGLNLGIDFTGGSILNYSVGENYDVNDVEAILNASGYTDNQITKAAPSTASKALQAELAAAAQAEAEAPAEDAEAPAEEAEAPAEAEETAVEEVAEEVEEAAETVEKEAEEVAEAVEEAAEPAPSLLNTDKSGIAADGLTDLQIRLKLADATAGMEDVVKGAVAGVVSGASETSYRTATNMEISDLGYELTYAGGNIIEFDMGGDFDKAAVESAVTKALEDGGYSLTEILFVKYDAEAEAAALAEAQAALEEAEAETEETAEATEATEETAEATEAEETEEAETEKAEEAVQPAHPDQHGRRHQPGARPAGARDDREVSELPLRVHRPRQRHRGPRPAVQRHQGAADRVRVHADLHRHPLQPAVRCGGPVRAGA